MTNTLSAAGLTPETARHSHVSAEWGRPWSRDDDMTRHGVPVSPGAGAPLPPRHGVELPRAGGGVDATPCVPAPVADVRACVPAIVAMRTHRPVLLERFADAASQRVLGR
jgi:hypothetical protein